MRHQLTLALVILALSSLSGVAAAQPEADAPPAPAADEPRESDEAQESGPVTPHTATSVADMPPPDRANGYRVPPPGPGVGHYAWRVAGFVPLWLTRIVFAPVRGLMWVYERYALDVRFRQLFFTADGTIGLFPFVSREAGFGVSLGAKFLHRSLFDRGEKLSLTATGSGASRAYASLVLNSGNRWRSFRLRGNVTYNSLRRARFDGVGNLDLASGSDPDDLPQSSDPFSPEFAVDTRYSFDEFSVRLGADVPITDHLVVQFTAEHIRRNYNPDDNDAARYQVFTGDVYDTSLLPGFEEGLNTLAGHVVVQYDRSSLASRYNSKAVPSRGYRATGLVGYAYGVGADPSNFVRISGALEGFINLFRGDRVLALRAYYETVSANRRQVPFDQLPTLGGANLLRGFIRGRFRDSSVALVSAEYSYPVLNTVSGFLFVDAGVPFAGFDDFELDNPRLGYGGGIQFQTQSQALGRLDVSSSNDGGILLNLTFQPFFQVDQRAQ